MATLVYHIPPITKTNPTLAELLELVDIAGVVGLKFTDWNLFLLRRLRLERPDIVIFNGFDEMFTPAMMYGADGGIGTNYNLFPRLFVNMYRSVKSGDIEKAMDMQLRFMSYTHLL